MTALKEDAVALYPLLVLRDETEGLIGDVPGIGDQFSLCFCHLRVLEDVEHDLFVRVLDEDRTDIEAHVLEPAQDPAPCFVA